MSQSLDQETIQSVIAKLARHSISEEHAKNFLNKRARESRDYFQPTLWTAFKRYSRRGRKSAVTGQTGGNFDQ